MANSTGLAGNYLSITTGKFQFSTRASLKTDNLTGGAGNSIMKRLTSDFTILTKIQRARGKGTFLFLKRCTRGTT